MHTLAAKGGALFHYNSDLSGKVVVAEPLGEEARVDFKDLAEFVDTCRSRRSNPPKDLAAFVARRKALPEAKQKVVQHIDDLREDLEELGKLDPLMRQMFDVAINMVKGAR